MVVSAASSSANGGSNEVTSYLSSDGALKKTVKLTDAQEGFVGVTGTLWIIEPTGSWRIANFVNEQVYEPRQQGHLSQDQLAVVANVLASGEFCGLPHQFGRRLKVNRHMVTIGFGRTTATLVLNAAEPAAVKIAPTLDASEADALVKFLHIFEGIQNLLEEN